MAVDLQVIYNTLLTQYGKQYWWPAETRDEVVIGAILTQNTNWMNVSKAIENLKQRGFCSLVAISNIDIDSLAYLIRPSGYFNQKASKLKDFACSIDLDELNALDLNKARVILLKKNGIGPETADSILLYALNKPIFVIDAYTIRLFSRLGLILKDTKYQTFQDYFMKNLNHDVELFNEYHALIVKHCVIHCKKKPLCEACCLEYVCEIAINS